MLKRPLGIFERMMPRSRGASIAVKSAIAGAYRALLARAPDPEGEAYYLELLEKGEITFEQLLRRLMESREFRRNALSVCGHPEGPAGTNALADGTNPPSEGTLLDWKTFEALWRELLPPAQEMVIGQAQYLEVHKRRFYELADAVKRLLPEGGRLCEFGVSEFSRFYKRLCPDCFLVTVDRPTEADYPGFIPERCRRIAGCDHHFSVDLEARESVDWERLQAAGPYDLLLFAEVLEHLLVEPIALLRDLLMLLSPAGLLYLTTPNYFRPENREQLAAGCNPQPYYPGTEENWDAHYHYREYSMPELMDVVEKAGGVVAAAYFSDCWDRPGGDSTAEGFFAQGAELVLIARPSRTER